MKILLFMLIVLTLTLWGAKPLPPGAGASIKPNVLFVVDNSGSMGAGHPSRMAQSKAALRLLLDDNNITRSIRLGLSQFPNRSWGCGSDRRQLLSPVRDATVAHIATVKNQVNRLRASGGTPLGNALRHSLYYFKNQASSYNLSFYPSAEVGSPVIHRCQRNYVIIFTDGGECCHCSSWSGRARTEASNLYNNGLSGFTINGNNMEYPEIPVYAIGFHGVNVNYIAAAGGTGTGYNASDQNSLLTAFQQIIRDIGAKNITATTPTLIPGFTGPDNDVVYMSKFVPREDKQWMGHLYRYHLGTGADVLSTSEWDLSEGIKSKVPGDERKILTICKNNIGTTKKFQLSKATILADCMVVNASSGAGNPVEVCTLNPGSWDDKLNSCQDWDDVYGDNSRCYPEREDLEPVCIGDGTLLDRIKTDSHLLNSVCAKDDLAIYTQEASCNNDIDHDAKMVKRYMCQKLETYCGCYKSFRTQNNEARSCTIDANCGGGQNSCVDGFCVGEPQKLNDPSIWEPQHSELYANNIARDSITFASPNSSDYNKVEITLENLKFHNRGNTTSHLRDYLAIKESAHPGDSNNNANPATPEKYNFIAKVGSSLNFYECSAGATFSIGSSSLDVRGCNVSSISDSRLVKVFNTHEIKLIFHSNGNYNAQALKVLKAYRVKHTDVRNCHWEPGGGGGTPAAEAELKEVKRLINFFRGKDSFQEDNVLSNPDVCSEDTSTNCPDRLYPLADIYNSSAKFIGTPNQLYTYNSYKDYKNSHIVGVNQKLILVGSNGGMLHAVHTKDSGSVHGGEEAWGFIPPNLLTSLKDIRVGVVCTNGNCTTPDYDKTASQFYVDSSVKLMDVCRGTCSSGSDWRTVAVITFGEGGAGLMALDLTDHLHPHFLWAVLNETPKMCESPLYNSITGSDCKDMQRVIYWEEDGTRIAYQHNIPASAAGSDSSMDNSHNLVNLANTWSQPVLAQIGGTSSATGQFVAILGAGGVKNQKTNTNNQYGSSVYVLDIFTGLVLSEYQLPTDSAATAVPAKVPALVSILPEPDTASVNGLKDRIVSQIYVGDLSGSVWRLNAKTLVGKVDCDSSSSCTKLIDINSNSTKEDYIYKGVAISYDGKPSDDDTSLWVYFGTGDSSIYGLSKNTGSNHLVAIKDQHWDGTSGQATINYSSLTDISAGDPRLTNSDCDAINGWKFELPNGSSAEKAGKLVGKPIVIDGYVYYTVYFHGEDTDTSECSGHLGKSYLYSFKLFSGCYNDAFTNDPSDPYATYSARAFL